MEPKTCKIYYAELSSSSLLYSQHNQVHLIQCNMFQHF